MVAAADVPVEPGAPRPAPRYGEYATPEEVAAARGPLPVEPSDPVSRLAAPLPPSAPPRRALQPPPYPRRANNLITTLLLIFGIWNTLGSIPSYLDFGAALSQGFEIFGYGTIAFGPVAHTAGIVLLVASLLILVVAIGLSLRLMRDGRRSVWVPLAAGALFVLVSLVVTTVIVANTPGLAQVLHNH